MMPVAAEEAPPLSHREQKLLMSRVSELGPTEHEEIFNMLTSEGVQYMQNRNGVFVNLSGVAGGVMRRIQSFVTFCIDNKTSLDEYDNHLNEQKFTQTFEKSLIKNPEGGQQQGQQGQGQQHAIPNDAEEDGLHRDIDKVSIATGGPQQQQEQPQLPQLPQPPQQQQQQDQMQQLPQQQHQPTQHHQDNAKYAQARKKYAKRKVPDKKSGGGGTASDPSCDLTTNVLTKEAYPITA
jgi:hypothetical protein